MDLRTTADLARLAGVDLRDARHARRMAGVEPVVQAGEVRLYDDAAQRAIFERIGRTADPEVRLRIDAALASLDGAVESVA